VAKLLEADYAVTVHDAVGKPPPAVSPAAAAWAPSAAAAAAHADTVITCLPTPRAVAVAVAGEGGVLTGIRAGACWIDLSTNDADELCRLAALASASGVDTLDAPVTGGVHKAATGELAVLVSGRARSLRRATPAARVRRLQGLYLGPLGQASKMKVITNMLAFVHLVAAGEALMLAGRAGIDLKEAFEAIKASSGNSFRSRDREPGDPVGQLRHRLHSRPRL